MARRGSWVAEVALLLVAAAEAVGRVERVVQTLALGTGLASRAYGEGRNCSGHGVWRRNRAEDKDKAKAKAHGLRCCAVELPDKVDREIERVKEIKKTLKNQKQKSKGIIETLFQKPVNML